MNSLKFASEKYFGSTAYYVDADPESIKKEIMTNGSVEVAFDVFSDFMSYKKGVYMHSSGKLLGKYSPH